MSADLEPWTLWLMSETVDALTCDGGDHLCDLPQPVYELVAALWDAVERRSALRTMAQEAEELGAYD